MTERMPGGNSLPSGLCTRHGVKSCSQACAQAMGQRLLAGLGTSTDNIGDLIFVFIDMLYLCKWTRSRQKKTRMTQALPEAAHEPCGSW